MNKRNFFKSLAKAAGIIALAPQLCFKSKFETIECFKTTPPNEKLYAMVKQLEHLANYNAMNMNNKYTLISSQEAYDWWTSNKE